MRCKSTIFFSDSEQLLQIKIKRIGFFFLNAYRYN